MNRNFITTTEPYHGFFPFHSRYKNPNYPKENWEKKKEIYNCNRRKKYRLLGSSKKTDQHEFSHLVRYRLRILTTELEKLGLVTQEKLWDKTDREQLASEKKANFLWLEFDFSLVLAMEKKLVLSENSLDNKNLDHSRLFFYYTGTQKKEVQEKWLLIWLIKKHQSRLSELLVKKPLLFRQKLQQLVWQLKHSQQWASPKNLVITKDKFPMKDCKYGTPNYYQKQSLASLLWQNKEASGKTDFHPVADFDIHSLSEHLQPIIKQKVAMLINYLQLPYYGKSQHGSPHLYFRSFLPLPGGKISYCGQETNYQFQPIGDLKAKGNYVVLPISEGRDYVFTQWGQKISDLKREYWLKSREYLTQIFNKFGFYFSWQLVCPVKTKISRAIKPVKQSAELGRKFEVPLTKILRENIKPLPQLASLGGSRESFYYQVPYTDQFSQTRNFLVDAGYRASCWQRLNSGSELLTLTLSKGERTDFLVGCY
jgi:hypothetical protein